MHIYCREKEEGLCVLLTTGGTRCYWGEPDNQHAQQFQSYVLILQLHAFFTLNNTGQAQTELKQYSTWAILQIIGKGQSPCAKKQQQQPTNKQTKKLKKYTHTKQQKTTTTTSPHFVL